MNNFRLLDEQLERLSRQPDACHMPVFGSDLNKATLASDLASEIQAVLRYARLEWPDVVEELSSPIPLKQRYDALLGYFHLMQMSDFKDPAMQRAKIITELYFDLIYFRDRILELLYERIVKERKFGNSPCLSEWLELVGDSDFAKTLRAFRNGFAHGKWAFLSDFSGVMCFPEKKPPYNRYQWTNGQLLLIHGLLYGFQVVLFMVAREQLDLQSGA